MKEKALSILKTYGIALAVIAASIGLFAGDTEQLQLQLYAMGSVSMVLLIAKLIFDDRPDWGFFPFLDLSDLAAKAKESATGAAIVFASVIYLIAQIIGVTVIRR